MKTITDSCSAVRSFLTVGIVCFLASTVASAAQLDSEAPSNADPVIGAKVVGPGLANYGVVEGVVVNARTGNAEMYLVRTRGWFSNYGVIPLNFVESTSSRLEKNGETSHSIHVSINRATFDNIAHWDGEGPVDSYLQKYSSILGIIYGIDKEMLKKQMSDYRLRDANSTAGFTASEQ